MPPLSSGPVRAGPATHIGCSPLLAPPTGPRLLGALEWLLRADVVALCSTPMTADRTMDEEMAFMMAQLTPGGAARPAEGKIIGGAFWDTICGDLRAEVAAGGGVVGRQLLAGSPANAKAAAGLFGTLRKTMTDIACTA